MFLSAYHFDGPPAELLPAYRRLHDRYPPDRPDLHICTIRDGGITVYDACPSREVFEHFSGSDEFRASVLSAGLPLPRAQPLGEVCAPQTADVGESP
jgi:hypothetical protein